MKSKLIILFFLIISNIFGQNITDKISFIAYCGKYSKLEETIDLEYLQQDIDILKNYINKLPEKVKTKEDLIKIYPSFESGKKCNCSSENFELGRNLKSISYTQYGGYSNFNIDIIYSKENILKLRITMNSNSEIIEKYLNNKIKLLFECKNGIPTFDKYYFENIKKYEIENGKLFFEIEDTNTKRKEVINFFMDNLSGSEFKEPYYLIDIFIPFDNLRYLIVNEDYEGLIKILQSSNPTSRIFAARTLRYLINKNKVKLNKLILNLIEYELTHLKPISCGVISCWSNKFDYDYYNLNKDFENLLKTQ